MQASPNRSGLPPRAPSKTPSPNRSGLPPSKTPSPKRNSAFNHIALSVKKTDEISSNKMANRLLQLAEVRKKSEMIEVPKAHTKITLDEYFKKKAAFWNQIRFINDENRCVSKNEDFIALRNLLMEYSKITPVQICSAVKDAIDKGFYLSDGDVLIEPTAPPPYYAPPQPSAPPANASYYKGATAPPPPYYNEGKDAYAMTKPSAPPANNHDPRPPRGGTKRKNRSGRKTRANRR